MRLKTVHLSGTFFFGFLLFIFLLPASSFGEILTVKHTVKQTLGAGSPLMTPVFTPLPRLKEKLWKKREPILKASP